MSYLTPADIDDFSQRLEERREALRKILRAAFIASLHGEQPEHGRDVHDASEESFAELTLGVDLAAHAREIQELRDIDATLKRIAIHSVGYCIECAGEIGLKRLDAFLTAKRCLSCQQHYERKRSGGTDQSPSL